MLITNTFMYIIINVHTVVVGIYVLLWYVSIVWHYMQGHITILDCVVTKCIAKKETARKNF